MIQTTTQTRLTTDDFQQIKQLPRYADKIIELVNGEVIELNAPRPKNAFIAGEILFHLKLFIRQYPLGYVFGADGGYTLPPNNERIPDVSFVRSENMPDKDAERLLIAPDLAVEVISPNERPRDILSKVELFLRHGTRLFWNVYPDEQIVEVWELAPNDKLQMQSYDINGVLTGGDVLPGFELPVMDIFAGWDAQA